jgi:hypothetical protein
MKTRLLRWLFAPLLFGSAWASSVSLLVVDGEGRPLAQAETSVMFHSGAGGSAPWPVKTAVTDILGRTKVEGMTPVGFDVWAEKAGYYTTTVREIPVANTVERTLVLRVIKSPIPLYARSFGHWTPNEAVLPAENTLLGYDFQAGDWLPPYGKGRVTDIQFKYLREFRGYRYEGKDLEEMMEETKKIYARNKEDWTEDKFKVRAGKWSGELEISFPGEKEGIVEELQRFMPSSQLKLPHEAPEGGYLPAWKYTANNFSPTTWRPNVGFYLRTRVKLDDRGNIISANYAKVLGDFHFYAQGELAFDYYFNPTPNDRNLEFDRKKNLFGEVSPSRMVRDP